MPIISASIVPFLRRRLPRRCVDGWLAAAVSVSIHAPAQGDYCKAHPIEREKND